MDVRLGFVTMWTPIGPRIEEVGGMTCIITLIFLERELLHPRKKVDHYCIYGIEGAAPVWCGVWGDNE